MGIFRRRDVPPERPQDPSPSEDVPQDPEFTFFTRTQAATFRRLVRAAFADLGLEVTVHADHVVDADGTGYGLGNLAASCHNAESGEAGWPEVIARHVRSITSAMRDASPFDTMTTPQLHALTYSRVIAEDALLSGMETFARPVAPGLVEVLNLDLPTTVMFYTADHVTAHGPAEDLFRIGRVNLRDVEPDESHPLRHEGGTATALLGDSMFIASTLVNLPEVVERETGSAPDPDSGVLVVVPNRHQLAFHLPHDETVIASVNLLIGFADAGFEDGVGPVSPDLYWWHHGRLERVSHHDPEKGIVVDVSADLQSLLEELTSGS